MTLTMSVLAGVLALSRHCSVQGLTPEEGCAILAKGLPGSGQYDYASAARVVSQIGWLQRDQLSDSWHDRLFALVDAIVSADRPDWLSLVPYGRMFALDALDADYVQCLRHAGLLGDSERARAWWAKLEQWARAELDLAKLEVGRRGEHLSMQLERQKLLDAARPDLHPTWSSLDDNTLGYDIESWLPAAGGVALQKTIEVKASKGSPVLIHVSRGQWRYAQSADRHEFHIWNLNTEQVRVLLPQELECHVPVDRSDGQWTEFTLAIEV